MFAKYQLIIVFTPHLKFLPYSEDIPYMKVQYSSERKYNKDLKKKRSIIQFDAFDLCFILFIPMSQTVSVIDKTGACYFLHASN